MEIGSFADVCIAIVTIVGVSISVREYMRSNKLKRSSCIEPLVDKLKSKENNLSILAGLTVLLFYLQLIPRGLTEIIKI